MNQVAVIDLLRRQCTRAGSQASFAAQNKLSPPYLNDVLSGRREPGPAILKALGMEKIVSYRKISGAKEEK